MIDRATIQALIEQGYTARKNGDVEGILSLFHPQGRFQLVGSPEVTSLVGIASGHSALRAAMTGFIAKFEFLQRDVVSILIDGNQAAVHSRVKLRSIPKNRTEMTDILDLWKFEDGKIVELVEFADTALINLM